MIPTSEELESFFTRIKELDSNLAKLKSSEVTRLSDITALREISKEWLRLSQALQRSEQADRESLGRYDSDLQSVLQSTNSRGRASAYRKKIKPLIHGFVPNVLTPLIKHEGSPSQVAARQVTNIFQGVTSTEEKEYIDEAAMCMTVKSHRAAIIMLWASAIARFHTAIQKNGFDAYNQAMDRATQKKGSPFNKVSKTPVSSLPELQRGREFDILVIGMDLFKYDLQVFEELERLLGIRNSAAHPGMLHPNTTDVTQFASKIRDYVFANVKV